MNKMLRNILLLWFKKSEKILHQNLWLNKSRYIRYYRRQTYKYIVNRYKKKIIEGADLTDSDIQKMSDTAAELEQLKLQQSNIIKDINTVDTQTKAMNRKLTDEKSKIDDSIKKSESQAEDAKDGKEVCPE